MSATYLTVNPSSSHLNVNTQQPCSLTASRWPSILGRVVRLPMVTLSSYIILHISLAQELPPSLFSSGRTVTDDSVTCVTGSLTPRPTWTNCPAHLVGLLFDSAVPYKREGSLGYSEYQMYILFTTIIYVL